MYLYSRRMRVNSFDAVTWASDTAAAHHAATGVEMQVWGAVFSAGFGTIAWTAWHENFAALDAAADAAMADAAYMAKSAEGNQWAADGVVDDQLQELIAGAPDPDADPLYVSSVQSACAGGNMARGLGAAVEIAQRADAITGATTLVCRNVTGPYSGVAWFTGTADGATMDAQNAALAADAGFLELVDSFAGAFIDVVDPRQSVLWRRLG